MGAAARVGDVCTGHGCFPPRTCDSGSSDVFINGQGANRIGDHWVEHTCGDNTHDGVTVQGSSTVFINGIGIARLGDLISCGSAVSQGSPNVFTG